MSLDGWRQSIEAIANDRKSGASEIASVCLDVMADYASHSLPSVSLYEVKDDLVRAAERLLSGQPAMAPVLCICNAALLAVERSTTSQEALGSLHAAMSALRQRMQNARSEIAGRFLSAYSEIQSVVTLSYSSTVAAALRAAGRAGTNLEVTVLESRPALEGRTMARIAADAGLRTTLAVDAAGWNVMERADMWMSGADALLGSGVVNKVGTASLAAAAYAQGKQGVVLCETMKIWPGTVAFPALGDFPPAEVWEEAPKHIEVVNRYFERVPWTLVDRVLTEEGPLNEQQVVSRTTTYSVAASLRGHFV